MEVVNQLFEPNKNRISPHERLRIAGGNRFATILLYMTDIPENSGGQTVFSEVYDPQVPINEIVLKDQALAELRDLGAAAAAGIKSGSWEEDMLAMCGSSKLTVTPSRGRAVLFYSQLPNGEADPMSKHGEWNRLRSGVHSFKRMGWAATVRINRRPEHTVELTYLFIFTDNQLR